MKLNKKSFLLILSSFLLILAIVSEHLKPGNFISFCLLFISIILLISAITPSKRLSNVLILFASVEFLLSSSILILSNLSGSLLTTDIGRLRRILLPHNKPFSKQTVSEIEFSPLLGRKYNKNHPEIDKEGWRFIPNRPKLYNKLINIYGGSSTYGTGTIPSDSWGNQLQILLNNKNLSNKKTTIGIRNLGLIGGTTAEAIVIQSFYDYVPTKKLYPSCSIHYHGWNDLRNNYVPKLDPSYSNWHLLSVIYRDRFGSSFSSIIATAKIIFRNLFKENQIPIEPKSKVKDAPQELDPKLIEIYKQNIKTIAYLSKSNGGKAIFVPQMMNPYKLKGNTRRSGWIPNVNDGNVMGLITQMNQILREEAISNDAIFAEDIKQELFSNKDFVDVGHLSKAGSKKFAALLYPTIEKCIK